MHELLEFLKGFNIQTILSMALIVWLLTKDIKRDLQASINTLHEDMKKMDKRISRIEGTVYGTKEYKKIFHDE